MAVDDVLAEVTLVDVAKPKQPLCESPTLVAKEGGNQDDLLERVPAETWRYSCSSTITEPTTNVAVVGALGGGNDRAQRARCSTSLRHTSGRSTRRSTS